MAIKKFINLCQDIADKILFFLFDHERSRGRL